MKFEIEINTKKKQEIIDLTNPISGCKFSNRCPYAKEICFKAKPKTVDVDKDHYVRCWLYSKR